MQQDDRGGLLFALGGFAMLALGDAVVKSMSGLWAPTAISALRYVFGAIGLSALLLAGEGRDAFRVPRPGMQMLRGACVGIATLCFFSALFLMTLAEATTIVFVSPMITALLAPLFLGERSRWATWTASVAAFAGVLIVLRPNFAELGVGALLPLGAAAAMAVLFMANRSVAGAASALAMQAYLALAAVPILLAATVLGHFSGAEPLHVDWPQWTVVARCAVVAVTASTGHYLIYMGTTRAGASTIAPMTYVQLLVAVALGWWWFADVPDLPTLVGGAIIIGAGLYLWHTGRGREVGKVD